jgi:diacylglycerol kinase
MFASRWLFCSAWVPRFTARKTGYEAAMGLLWLLVLLLIIFALVGGVAVNNWLLLILVIALILLLVGYV